MLLCYPAYVLLIQRYHVPLTDSMYLTSLLELWQTLKFVRVMSVVLDSQPNEGRNSIIFIVIVPI